VDPAGLVDPVGLCVGDNGTPPCCFASLACENCELLVDEVGDVGDSCIDLFASFSISNKYS